MISYNVFRDGQLFKENQTNKEIKSLIGIYGNNIHRYLNTGKTYKTSDGHEYSFTEGLILSGHKDRVIKNDAYAEKSYSWPQDKIDEWNEIRQAAHLLKNGGHIGYKNGRRCVMP
jgi:hypothetical protein